MQGFAASVSARAVNGLGSMGLGLEGKERVRREWTNNYFLRNKKFIGKVPPYTKEIGFRTSRPEPGENLYLCVIAIFVSSVDCARRALRPPPN
jgi:hypothetical protein